MYVYAHIYSIIYIKIFSKRFRQRIPQVPFANATRCKMPMPTMAVWMKELWAVDSGLCGCGCGWGCAWFDFNISRWLSFRLCWASGSALGGNCPASHWTCTLLSICSSTATAMALGLPSRPGLRA